MKVFNLYLKLLKKNIGTIITFTIIFLGLAVVFSSSSNTPSSPEFQETQIKVTIINEDGETELITNLKQHLDKYVTYVDVKKENIPDALYFRKIYHAFTIPQNFTSDFLSGKDVIILHENTPESISNFSVEQALNSYLKLVKVYQKELPNESLTNIFTYINNDLSKNVATDTKVAEDNEKASAGFYYNYASYLIFALVLSIVGTIMMKFRKHELKNRMAISPYKNSKTNLELFLGNLIFTLAFMILIFAFSFVLYPNSMKTTNGLVLMVNAFCLTIAVLSFAYFICLFVKDENILSGVNNVVSMGTAFISGAFVPQFLLGKGILTFAHILPNYYYVYNNDRIIEIQNFTWENLQKIVLYMGIQLLFALLFIVLSIIVSRKQATQEQ